MLKLGERQMSVWDVLEKLYLDKGWRVDEGEEKTLLLRPGDKTDVQVEGEETGSIGEVMGSYTKRYQIDGFELEAGFICDKAEIILGEQVFLTFTVTNRSKQPYKFRIGGDNRGSVRHNNFRITAIDANGQAVKDPYSYEHHGGRGSVVTLEKDQTYTERLFLGHWCDFERLGEYTITCRRTLAEEQSESRFPKVPVDVSFKFKVSSYDVRQKMRGIFAQLSKKLHSGDKHAASEATIALAHMKDEYAIPHLAGVLVRGDSQSKRIAIDGLLRFPPKKVEGIIKEATALNLQSKRAMTSSRKEIALYLNNEVFPGYDWTQAKFNGKICMDRK